MTIPEADAVSTLLRYLAPGSTVPAEDAADAAAYLTGKVHSALLAGPDPAQVREWVEAHAARLRDAETDRDRLRHALERAAQAVAHDYDSAACRERPAYQERLKPCQQRPPEHDEDCPACDLQTALDPAPDDCGCDRHDASTPEATP